MNIRKKINPLISRENYSLSPNISSTKFIVVPNSKILEEEVKKLFQNYPSLNDGVPVELKQSVEYENKAVYFGEWEKN